MNSQSNNKSKEKKPGHQFVMIGVGRGVWVKNEHVGQLLDQLEREQRGF